MNITISIATQISNNLKKATCIPILFTSLLLFPLELFLIQLLKLFHLPFSTFIQPQLFLPNTLLIPVSLVSSSPHKSRCITIPLLRDYASRCTVIPLPRILVYTNCMLANAWRYPYSRS
jgi:hypothetical protein